MNRAKRTLPTEFPLDPQPPRIKRDPGSDLAHRLISSTVEAFAEKGILGARVAEITHAAGTTDPAFYRYFPSIRDSALYIIGEYYWRPLNQRIAHFQEVTSDPVQIFEAVLAALVRSTEDDHSRPWLAESKVFRIVVSELRNPFLLPDSLLDAEYLKFLKTLETLFRDGQAKGCFDPRLRPVVMAHSLVMTVHGLFVENALSPRSLHISEEEIREVAFRLVGFEVGARIKTAGQ
jgi:AcrR family transcriptional regulator